MLKQAGLEGTGPRAEGSCFRTGITVDDRRDDSVVTGVVAQAQAGDKDALRFLYLRYADAIYGYVLSIVRDEHDAEDVTQQVFVKLMRVIGKYEQRHVTFAAWLFRVARNVALDHLRARRTVPCEDALDPTASSHDAFSSHSGSLRDALAELPDDQRNVVVLRHVVGLSPGEIAGVLGKTEGSIHGLHNRGRRTLVEVLTDLDAAPTTRAS